MNTIVIPISSKGQITVPKSVRELLGVKLGGLIKIEVDKNEVTLERQPSFDDYIGMFKGYWGDTDPAEDIRRDRDESDRDDLY